MNRFTRILTLAVGSALFVAAGATVAHASPSKTAVCTACHGGTALAVNITPVTVGATSASYSVSAPGASYLSVFRGTTKLSSISGSTGSFTVATGSTYTVYAVKGPSTSTGVGSASVSPVAPPTDTAAPVTTSNALASYPGAASILLTAADNAGGSGVAATYYRLDGATAVSGTQVTVSAAGAHVLEFWSRDVAGNVESPVKSVSFTVEAVTTTSPTLGLSASASTVNYRGSAILRGSLLDGTPVPGAVIALESSADGVTWTRSASVYLTDALGSFTATVAPSAKTRYRVVFDGAGDLAAATSVSVIVTPRVSLSTPGAPSSVVRGRSFTAYSYLKPRHSAGTYPITLQFYRYQSGKWVLRKSITAKAANYSTYTKASRSLTLPYTGKWRVRAYHPADAQHAATYSGYRTITVR